jgi:Na+/melibiose symporter-like transporter
MPTASLQSKEKKLGANTPSSDLPTAPEKTERVSPKQRWVFLRSLLGNKPLLLIVGAILLKYVAAGMFAGLLFIYVDVYLNLGQHFALMMILGFVGSLVSIPVWQRLANAFSKKAAWMLAMTLALTGFIYFGTLGPDSQFYHLIIANSLISAGAACTWSVTTAMYADVVDYSHWKYRVERTATYFSLYTLMAKLTGSLAISLGLGIAGWYGLDATATTHSEQAVWGLKLAMSWIPVVFTLFALVFIALFPINNHRHSIIRRRLDQRAARMASALTRSVNDDSREASAINNETLSVQPSR